ncbi:DUF721 domain-containing protein [Desulfonatronum thioautotrophicum]|uniref:DUF721 domain-containing protein n=1 Tax=Desulfonatronum thioautotrophicum TaxID=617001 RepID=UPI00069A07E6|nr:DUF721 domain-containing protein [Desulfonatronum thioautotrophicum]
MAFQLQEVLHEFWSGSDRALQWRLAEIWSSWPTVVGQEIADLAMPLGRNKSTLLLGVEDALVMQEMHFHAPNILRAVNAALGEKVFDRVHLDLLSGRSSLSAVAEAMKNELREERKAVASGFPVTATGANLRLQGVTVSKGRFSAVPALERCYQTYVRSLERMNKRHEHPEDVAQPDITAGN